MKIAVLAVAAVAVFRSAAQADVPCEAPIEPAIGQDAGELSRDDMLALFRSVKTFQVKAVRYRECLEANEAEMDHDGYVDLHNASIAAEEFVVERFNDVFARFKKRAEGAR